MLWDIPIAVVNQYVLYDDIAAGRTVRWRMESDVAQSALEDWFAEALTPPDKSGNTD